MPIYANAGSINHNKVNANELAINHNYNCFYCCTDGCKAEMTLCKPGTGQSYFRSKYKKEHISSECIKNSIIFNPDKYAEEKFDPVFAFESILGIKHTTNNIYRGDTGTQQGQIGNNKTLRICTLPLLYSMCISKNNNDTYNGIIISDIFANSNNFDRYSTGIVGYKIVETSFYYANDKEKSFMLNYPLDNRGIKSWVKIVFNDTNLYNTQKKKMKNSMHIEPFIVAGNWILSATGSKNHSECIIHKKRQIYYAKIQ